MSKRPLSSLALSTSELSALTRGGYETVEDLSSLDPESLARDLNIPLTSSQAIFSATQAPKALPLTQSAAFMIGSITQHSTLCEPLDRLLQGGLKQGYILELSGPPGCSKETLAINITKSFVESLQEVLFVDMQNMTSPATLNRQLRKQPSDSSDYKKLVYHLHLHTLPDLLIFLRNLPSYLQSHPRVKGILIFIIFVIY